MPSLPSKPPITPLRWYGSKRRSLDVIDRWLPLHVMEYREPFVGGGASLLLARFKYPDVPFWINDKDRRVTCFWSTVRDAPEALESNIKKLVEQARMAETSAETLYAEQLAAQQSDNALEAATAFLIINMWSFNALMGPKDFRWDYVQKPRMELFPRIRQAHALLQGVTITNGDYAPLLSEPAKGPSDAGVVVFMDPPYDGTETVYEEGVGFDFDGFYDAVLASKHNWIITHYLRRFWPRAFKLFYFGESRTWKVDAFLDGAGPNKRDERLIANFDPSSDLWRLFGARINSDGTITMPNRAGGE